MVEMALSVFKQNMQPAGWSLHSIPAAACLPQVSLTLRRSMHRRRLIVCISQLDEIANGYMVPMCDDVPARQEPARHWQRVCSAARHGPSPRRTGLCSSCSAATRAASSPPSTFSSWRQWPRIAAQPVRLALHRRLSFCTCERQGLRHRAHMAPSWWCWTFQSVASG